MKKDYFFVGVQLALFVLYAMEFPAWRFHSPTWLLVTALLPTLGGVLAIGVALLQLGSGLTPYPTPKANGQLIQSGIFAVVRHPIYTGILTATLGIGLVMGSGWKMVIAGALLILFHFKANYEESLLLREYPDYGVYQQKVGRFLPKWRSPKGQ